MIMTVILHWFRVNTQVSGLAKWWVGKSPKKPYAAAAVWWDSKSMSTYYVSPHCWPWVCKLYNLRGDPRSHKCSKHPWRDNCMPINITPLQTRGVYYRVT